MLQTAYISGEIALAESTVDLPDYWQAYGLEQPPFEESLQDAMYHPLLQWTHHLNYLQQLPQNLNALHMIAGPLGVGKSMLFAQYITQADNELPVRLLKSHMAVRVPKLINTIIHEFALADKPRDTTTHAQLEYIHSTFQQSKQRGVLLVDDAHRLPLETLSALVQLALMQEPTEIYLYVVLAGELQLQNRLKNLLEILAQNIQVPTLIFKALTFQETQSYIRHRLEKSGLVESIPFNDAAILRIHKLSGGIPGKINRVAKQFMADSWPENLNTQTIATLKTTKLSPSTSKIKTAHTIILLNRVRIYSIVLLIFVSGFAFMHYHMDHKLNNGTKFIYPAAETAVQTAIDNISVSAARTARPTIGTIEKDQ